MGAKLTMNYNCPMCGKNAFFAPKPGKPHPNLEFVQTKRGLRQYFHRDCYDKMIKTGKYWTS